MDTPAKPRGPNPAIAVVAPKAAKPPVTYPPCHQAGPIVAKVRTGGPIKSAKAGGVRMTRGGATATATAGGGRTTIGGGNAAPRSAPVDGGGAAAAAGGGATGGGGPTARGGGAIAGRATMIGGGAT